MAIKPGDRVAQLVIEKVHEGAVRLVDQLSESRRGSGALGSTGVGFPKMLESIRMTFLGFNGSGSGQSELG